jgi:membrane-bound ClpP family serine protease
MGASRSNGSRHYTAGPRPTKESARIAPKVRWCAQCITAYRRRCLGRTEDTTLPLPVALLAHPAGAYGALVVTIAALVHAYHTRAFVPAFTADSAAALTVLAFLHHAPDAAGLVALALGVVLLHAEFLRSTYGLAALLGLGACALGSWQLLASTGTAWPALPPPLRVAAALLGSLLILASVLRGMRVRTLPRDRRVVW